MITNNKQLTTLFHLIAIASASLKNIQSTIQGPKVLRDKTLFKQFNLHVRHLLQGGGCLFAIRCREFPKVEAAILFQGEAKLTEVGPVFLEEFGEGDSGVKFSVCFSFGKPP